MTQDARNTQFAGFAELLFDELMQVEDVWIDTCNDHWRAEWQQLIARRAYDLVVHAIEHPEHIPDMTVWLEDEE